MSDARGATGSGDAEKAADDGATERRSRGAARRARASATPAKVKAGSAVVRNKLASLLWLVAVVCALFLAVGALLIALKANEDNSIVELVVAGAEYLDGPFSLEGGIFTFADDADGRVKSALVNWGIAAVVYLVIGKILDRTVRP